MRKALTASGRQILSLLRRHGALSKAEVARQSGLSAQTASTLMRNLENGGFLLREATVRGRIGQPPAPMSINPNAAYSIGVSVCAQHIRSVLIDFGGNILGTHEATDDFTQPPMILRGVVSSICVLESLLDERQSRRIAGIGLTASSGCRYGMRTERD